MENVVRRASYKALDETHPAYIMDGLRYDASGYTSVDGGKTFYFCGYGKFCRTEGEAAAWCKEWES